MKTSKSLSQGLLAIFLLLSFNFVSCFNDDTDVAGTSVNTGNTITAAFVDSSGKAAAKITVKIRNSEYLPAINLTQTQQDSQSTSQTDEYGKVNFKVPSKGSYTIEARSQNQGLLVQCTLLVNNTSLELPKKSLQSLGRISGSVNLSDSSNSAVYVRIYGTDRIVKVDSISNTYTLDSLPPGLARVQVVSLSDSFASHDTSLVLKPNQAQNIPPLRISKAFKNEIYAKWPFKSDITIDTRDSVFKGMKLLTNYPVLLRLDSNSLDFSKTKTEGKDLRFAKWFDAGKGLTYGRKIQYEIESWDAIHKKASIWILVDSIFPEALTRVQIFYGKDSVPSFSNSSWVFDSAWGYAGVWHMNSVSGKYTDASPNKNTGVNTQGTHRNTEQAIAGLANMGADRSDILVQNDPSLQISGTLTLSAWVYGNSTGKIFEKQGSKDQRAYSLYTSRTDKNIEARIAASPIKSIYISNGIPKNDSTWYFVSFVYDGSSLSLYSNGKMVVRESYSGSIAINDEPLYLQQDLKSIVDEIRITSLPRSIDWLRMDYYSQKPGQNVVRIEGN